MKRLTFITIVLCLSLSSQAGLLGRTTEINKSATAALSLYYAANPDIIYSTPNYEHISCFLLKPDLSETAYSVAASGENQMVTGYASGGVSIGIPSTYLDQYGAYELIVNASYCLSNIPYMFDVIGSDRVDELRDGLTNLIVAGNDIIPATGMTLPKFTYSREGDAARSIVARGLSYSVTQPEVLLRLVDCTGSDITYATESAFSWATYALAPDVTGATPYAHLFTYTVSDSIPDGWYQIYTVTESNDRAIASVNTLILSPTPTIDESGLVSLSAFNEFISDVSTSFRNIRQGHPAEFTAYRTSTDLTRSVPGVSSLASRHAPSGSLYGLRSYFYDPFSEEYVITNWLYDYDEIYGADGRGKVFEAPIYSVTATAVIEDVTLTTTGDVE